MNESVVFACIKMHHANVGRHLGSSKFRIDIYDIGLYKTLDTLRIRKMLLNFRLESIIVYIEAHHFRVMNSCMFNK